MRLLGVPFTTKDVSRFLPQIYMQYHASTQELILHFLAVFGDFLSILIPFLFQIFLLVAREYHMV